MELKNSLFNIKELFSSEEAKHLFDLLGMDPEIILSFDESEQFLSFLSELSEFIKKNKIASPNKIDSIKTLKKFSTKHLEKVNKYLDEYSKLYLPIIGHFFHKKQVEQLDINLRQAPYGFQLPTPHLQLRILKDLQEIYEQPFVKEIYEQPFVQEKIRIQRLDSVRLIHDIFIDENLGKTIQDIINLKSDIEYIKSFIEKYPKTASRISISSDDLFFKSILDNEILNLDELDFETQVEYLSLKQKVNNSFSNIQELNYALRMKQIEDLVTTQATYLLDERLIDFTENNRNDAQTLRNVIKNKERFPKDEFKKLKEAFPCILAGVRDYAEYIPLEPELFDLVIIDEASQVSIAQAFPALLRAKKVLILGDKKQFSNIKAAQARGDTNREYMNLLSENFRANISTDQIKIERLKKFNIKTSILEFFEFISNYNIQLVKHFRGYKEIISYSNKYFYQGTLQVMKIRGKSIHDVIKFSHLETSPEDELYPNTNIKEVEFIISELKRLKDEGGTVSVGLITPHTNQQKLLVERIGKMPEWEYFQDKMQLKIMTFDTCQ